MTALFVYGTLKSDGQSGSLLSRSKRFPAKVEGRLFRMPSGVPALVLEGPGWIDGEFIEHVPPEVLQVCDLYEGVDQGLYKRVSCEVVIGLARHSAEVYVMPDAEARGGKPVPGGVWRNPIRRGRR